MSAIEVATKDVPKLESGVDAGNVLVKQPTKDPIDAKDLRPVPIGDGKGEVKCAARRIEVVTEPKRDKDNRTVGARRFAVLEEGRGKGAGAP